MILQITILALYCLMIIVIGVLGLRKTKGSKDFLLGGGKVGPFMTAFSYATAYFSAVVFIGFAGKVGWGFGYSGVWIGVFNGLIGVGLVWSVLGWKIKQTTTTMGVSTMNEFLEKRYQSRGLKLIASIAIFVFLIPYSAAVFIGLSYLFKTSFASIGITYNSVVWFIAIFTSIYLVLGGYKSMAIIDVIFGMIMVLGVGIMMFFTVRAGGGISSITESLNAINPKLTSAIGPPGWWPLFSLIFLTSVAPFAMPQLVQKFYAVKDQRSIKVGAVASTFFSLLIGCVAYFMGSTARVFLTPENTPAAFDNGKPIVDALMPELLNKLVPDSFLMIILLLLLSASMSTLASLILVSSSSFVNDFWKGFVNKQMNDKQITIGLRLVSLLFVLISAIIALNPPESIVTIFGISWGAIGSVFLGPFIWGLFSKRTNKTGAYISMIGSVTICLILFLTGSSSPEAGTVGMISSLILCPLGSLICRKQA